MIVITCYDPYTFSPIKQRSLINTIKDQLAKRIKHLTIIQAKQASYVKSLNKTS